MRSTLKCGFLASVAIAGLGAPEVALAQAATSDNGAPEIVVTANKRDENINKVGLTITAISGAALAERRITSLADVASAVPGLSFTPSTTNTPIFTLRGVGFNESSLGVYPAVSVYVDQAPLPFPVLASHSAFDLERIEVLKGPQGTLFGQNATGGAINYIAAKPTKELTAGGDVGYGRFGAIDGNAYISGPLAENIQGRIAVTAHHMDDWQRSVTRDDSNGHQDYIAARLLLDWQASDRIKFSLNLNGWSDRSQPQAGQHVALFPQFQPDQKPIYVNAPFVYGNNRAADWTHFAIDPFAGPAGNPTPTLTNFNPYSDRKFFQAALRADIDVTDDITLTSITSYDNFKQLQRTDGEGVAAIGFDLQQDTGKITSFNQELRLANKGTNALRWIIGGNYERSNTLEDQQLRYVDNSSNDAGNMFINNSGDRESQKITNYAFFGNVEYDVSSQLTVKGGIRYTESKISVNNCGYTTPNGHVNDLFNFLGSLNLLGLDPAPTFTPIGPDGCYTLNDLSVPGQAFEQTLKEHNVSWRAGIDYRITPTALAYLNVSRGYKAGSYPALAAATYAGLQPVTQESVTAFEAGFKTQLLDHRVLLNAAAFYYDYRNKQIRGKLHDPIFNLLDSLINVPKSRIYGAEADLTIRPVSGLTLTGAVTYLNSKILRGPTGERGFNVLGAIDHFEGDALTYTPKWSGMIGLDYRYETGHGAPFIGVSANFRGAQDAAIGGSRIVWPNDPAKDYKQAPIGLVYKLPAYATVDARLGYEAEEGRWRVMFWGKNIFDKYYVTAVVPAADSASRFAGMPATYGVTFGFKIK